MATTENNLKEAFAGESQANRKYLAFAKKAEQEGFSNVARLFRTAAEAETIHALGHLAAMDGVGATLDNLRAAMAGETYEYTEMYPPMVEQATADNPPRQADVLVCLEGRGCSRQALPDGSRSPTAGERPD